jgi:bacterioferritin
LIRLNAQSSRSRPFARIASVASSATVLKRTGLFIAAPIVPNMWARKKCETALKKGTAMKSIIEEVSASRSRKRVSEADKERLIDGLNHDLAAEWGTIIRYTLQSSLAVGLRGAELREILAKEIPDEFGHAKFLSDVIADLGGDPATTPRPFENPTGIRAMLELDLQLEMEDVENYTAHARLAEELGEIELKVKLEEMAADESRHARDLRRILGGLQNGERERT